MEDYAADHVEMADDDPTYFKQMVGHHIDEANVHMSRDELAPKVEATLRAKAKHPGRQNAGDLFGGDGFEGFEGFDIDDGNDEVDDLEAARNLDRGDKFYLGRARRTVFRVIGKKGAYVGTVQKPLVVDGSGERVLYELDAVKLGSDEEATVFGVFRIGGSGQRLDDAPFKKGELSVL